MATKITLSSATSDRDFAEIERLAENVTRNWPEFSGATITVTRERSEANASVSGAEEIAGAKLLKSVYNTLDVLKYSAETGW